MQPLFTSPLIIDTTYVDPALLHPPTAGAQVIQVLSQATALTINGPVLNASLYLPPPAAGTKI